MLDDSSSSFALLEEDFSDDRKDRIYHKLWDATLGRCLALAPIERRPTRVTELGLGSPAFVCDIARRNPGVSVNTINYFGSRSPAPFLADKPSSVRILSRNLELADWGHDPRICGKQHLVAGRLELDGLDWDWQHIARESFAALEPGGWLEIQTVGALTSDDGSADGTALAAIPHHLSRQHDGPRRALDDLAAVLAGAGFEEAAAIRTRWWVSPVSPRRGRITMEEALLADLYRKQVKGSRLLEAQCDEIRAYLGWTVEQAASFLQVVTEEIDDPSIQAYFPVNVVYGRKPSTCAMT